MRVSILVFLLLTSNLFGQTALEVPDIDGKVTHHKPPRGWEIHSGSPDVVEGQSQYFSYTYTLEYIEGKTNGETMVWMMGTRPDNPEAMKTEIKGLTVGEKYTVSVMWQQCAMMDNDVRKYWGGDLKMTVQGESKVFKSIGLEDGWQEATMEFEAKERKVTVVLSMHNPDYDPSSTWGGCIVVDNFCEECVTTKSPQDLLEAGGVPNQ